MRYEEDDVDDYKKNSATSSIVVAGYRPLVSSPPSSSSSSSSMVSRRVQLVTISHVPPVDRRHPTSEKNIDCLLPWLCLRGRRRSIHNDDNSDSDSDSDSGYGYDYDYDYDGGSQQRSLDPKGWKVSARWVVQTTKLTPYDTTAKIYETCTLGGGWPCKVEPNWTNNGEHELSAQKLERDIHAAPLLLPPHARKYLKRHCTIYVNKSLKWGRSHTSPVEGDGSCYHESKEWLVENGLSGDKHKCVEVNNAPFYNNDCDLWGIGGVMLHELSHAYHHSMVPEGYDNTEIQKCYDLAMKEGLYDNIKYHSHCRSSSSSNSSENENDNDNDNGRMTTMLF